MLLRRYELESKPYFCRDVNSYAADISKEQTHVRVKVVDVQDALQIMTTADVLDMGFAF